MRFSPRAGGVLAALGLALGLAAMPTPASAAPIGCTVGDLKNAIIAANGGGGTIDLPPGCTYTLDSTDNDSNGLPVITADVTINGNFATIERDTGSPLFRIFEVGGPAGKLTLNSITLRNGDLDAADDGGAILVDSGRTLKVRNASTITGNSARNGGAIFTNGITDIQSSTIRGNTASGFGGGIGVSGGGSLDLFATRVTANSGNFSGGLGFDTGTTGTIRSSFITQNTANVNGGGLANDGNLTVTGTQFAGNTANGDGGGLANDKTLTLTSGIFTGNTANRGGGLANFSASGQATINNSVFQANRATTFGGGLATFTGANTTVNTSAVVTNRAGTTAGGIYNNAATTTVNASAVAGNIPNNCLGSAPSVTGCVG